MPNPFASLNPANPMNQFNMPQLRNAYQMLMGGGNPMQAFSQMAMGNPRLQPIMRALQNGANPQQLFNSMCQERGINPQEFLRNITGNNGF